MDGTPHHAPSACDTSYQSFTVLFYDKMILYPFLELTDLIENIHFIDFSE